MKKVLIVLGVLLLCVMLTIGSVFGGWFDTWFTGQVDYIDQKIEDRVDYDTRKKVEDGCRAMIASYEADKLTWMQYKDSDSEEQRSWADQAMMRANRTASNYNNYILKNSFVWEGNIPDDIMRELPMLTNTPKEE